VRVQSRRAIEGGRIVKRMTITRVDTGETRQALESVRLYQPTDIEALATDAGLRVRTVKGTYAGGSFTEDSPRWIGLFEKLPTAES
jgi:predicted xylose isomerase-like sugar epimerase